MKPCRKPSNIKHKSDTTDNPAFPFNIDNKL